ncbi:Cell wall-associated hydrolase, NlpC family [Streptomyces sp. 3213]|uniref:C40 family peptidase n=1 Tax=Streptomyces sp. 3213.3 TaxID=1855348 RepID=UPI000898F722|nr:C40 family peptidase [Streptomyces sp. 3213.3]SED30276.1 Cell wall-associated hydrolase, NlpC family [Streptomyces sp. 3213] [Streptomyces sp. 3213.3]
MASHRRPKQPSRTRVTVLTTAAAAAVAFSAQAANAAPSEKPSKDEVKSKVDALYEQAEQATEKLDGAQEKQEKLQKEISTIQDNVARGQEELNKLRDGLGTMASAQYRTGGIDPSIQLFLSSDPSDYLDKASTMDQLSAQQVEALTKIQSKQRELAQERAEASTKLKDLSATRAELKKKKDEVKAKLASAQKLLNTLTAAEKAALDQEQANAASRSTSRVNLGNTGSASSRAAAAFAAGQTKIGSPYVYGASGPSSFDCSGFTSWAYAQAGVSIPRTSEAQANAGTRIYSESDLKVGDLVIFYGDYHHVGLYAGNGQVLHAPHTGAVVRYESIGNMPFQFGVRI